MKRYASFEAAARRVENLKRMPGGVWPGIAGPRDGWLTWDPSDTEDPNA